MANIFNIKVSPKSNSSMDNSEMYGATVEYTTVDILARLQDCSYNSFKNFQKVPFNKMYEKWPIFFIFKVSPNPAAQLKFLKHIVPLPPPQGGGTWG